MCAPRRLWETGCRRRMAVQPWPNKPTSLKRGVANLELQSQPGIHCIDWNHPKNPNDINLEAWPREVLQMHRHFVDCDWNCQQNKDARYQPSLHKHAKVNSPELEAHLTDRNS